MEAKTLTDIGFKRVINRKIKLSRGSERSFRKCKVCKNRVFYDFVPYSLSNPIITTPCHHDFKEYQEF